MWNDTKWTLGCKWTYISEQMTKCESGQDKW
jgi:hypothetical protein